VKDTQLLREFARGRQEPFEELLRLHGHDIKAYALRILHSPEQAEEVFVESFHQLAKQAKDWTRGGTVRGFLFTTAHRRCLDILRKRRTERDATPHLIDLERARSYRPSPEATAMLGELAEELEAAVAQLSDVHRQVLILRAMYGLTAQETAQVVGLDSVQVDSRYFYARKELRGLLRDAPNAATILDGGRQGS